MDIVERLRALCLGDQIYHPLLADEAADEIERLWAEIETMNAVHKQMAHQLADFGREIERLRADLKQACSLLVRHGLANEVTIEQKVDDG
jgi:hypothetical protein